MSGYEVEIRTGIKTEHNTLHTWLQIRHADGTEEAWGLHPEDGSDFSNVLLGPGRVKKEDEAKSYTRRSGPIWLSEDQYYDLMDNIHAQKHDPPEYSLVAYGDGEQCSMWAVDRLAEVDAVPSILTPSGTPPLNPFFLDSVAWNPITQTAGFWAHDHYERVSAGLSIALGTPLGLYLKEQAGEVVDWYGEGYQGVVGVTTDGFEWLDDFGTSAADWLSKTGDELVALATDGLEWANQHQEQAREWFVEFRGEAVDQAADIFEWADRLGTGATEDLTDFFEAMGGPAGVVESAWDYWTDDFIDDVRDFFNRGESHASPIILDLDGNGISTLGLEAGVQFDHNGDGFAQATGWVGPEDALLAMDLTGNEEIETGSELFGNASEIEEGVTAMNGFEALAIHDTNGNGGIDPGDEAWDDLRLWQDANGNGEVDDGELLTLDEVGIGSIDLGYSDSTYVDEHGNEHRQIGRFEWADGREGEATDVWFIQDTAHTEARERLDVPEDIATLPDLKGYGEVHDLHRARMRRTGRPSNPKALRPLSPGRRPVECEHPHNMLIDQAA